MVAALGKTISDTWTEPDGSGVTLFSEGDPLFDSMLADIAAARERAWMESYIFADDAIGRVLVDRLAECAARGVEVRVRVDAVGSRFGFSGGSAKRLGTSGARFRCCAGRSSTSPSRRTLSISPASPVSRR